MSKRKITNITCNKIKTNTNNTKNTKKSNDKQLPNIPIYNTRRIKLQFNKNTHSKLTIQTHTSKNNNTNNTNNSKYTSVIISTTKYTTYSKRKSNCIKNTIIIPTTATTTIPTKTKSKKYTKQSNQYTKLNKHNKFKFLKQNKYSKSISNTTTNSDITKRKPEILTIPKSFILYSTQEIKHIQKQINDKNSAKDMYKLAHYYLSINNYKESYRLFFKSANTGCSLATNYIFNNIKDIYIFLKDKISKDPLTQYLLGLYMLLDWNKNNIEDSDFKYNSLELLKKASNNGCILASITLSMQEAKLSCLENSLYVSTTNTSTSTINSTDNTDYTESSRHKLIKLLNKASNNKLNIPQAQLTLGQLYLEGQYVNQDIDKGLQLLNQSAENGHYESQQTLSDYYINGLYLDKNLSKAFYWCKLAASHGYKESEFQLASYYYSGVCCKKSYKKAIEYMLLADEANHNEAPLQLGLYYKIKDKPDMYNSMKYFNKAINYYQSQEAYFVLGSIYLNGDSKNKYNFDIPQDLRVGFTHMLNAGELNYKPAYYILGDCYSNGIGTKKDSIKALEWYLKAGSLGHPKALYKAGLSFISGQGGVEKNWIRGVHMIHQSSIQRNEDAENILNELLEKYDSVIEKKEQSKAGYIASLAMSGGGMDSVMDQ